MRASGRAAPTEFPQTRALAHVLAGIALASALAYAPVRQAGFVIDDVPIVRDNPVVRSGDVGTALRVGYWSAVPGGENGVYRPVVILSFMLDRGQDGSVDLLRAHLMNLGLHVLCAYALLFLLMRLGASLLASSTGALLFALHPVHVSVVSGLVGRAEILVTLFLLVAVVLHTWTGPWIGESGGERSSWRERISAWGAALSMFLALCSKEAAFPGPLLLPLLDVLFRPPRSGERRAWIVDRLGSYAPTALAAFVYIVLRTSALEGFPALTRINSWQNPMAAYHGASLTYTALGLVARYLRLLVFPTHLSADYSGAAVIGPEPTFFAIRPIVGLAALLCLAAIAVAPLLSSVSGRPVRAATRIAGFAAGFFLLTYFIVSNLVTLIGVALAERLLYLPSAGFLALVAVGCWRIAERGRRARVLVLSGLVAGGVLLALLTYRNAEDWRGEDSLWDAMVRSIPDSPLGHHLIGQRLARQGRLDEALAEFDAVLRTTPDSSADLYEKAVIFARRGDLAAAEPLYRRSVHLDPYYGPAQADYGIVLHRLGRVEEAERRLRYAHRRFPGMEKPVSELADLLFESGRYAEAAALYRRAVEMGRSDLKPRLVASELRNRSAHVD